MKLAVGGFGVARGRQPGPWDSLNGSLVEDLVGFLQPSIYDFRKKYMFESHFVKYFVTCFLTSILGM
jgi:hypothetical protein